MACDVTVTDFKNYFDRYFTFGATLPDIRDQDIQKAIAEAEAVFNQNLYPLESVCIQAKLYLTAHFLTLDIEASESGGQVSLIQNSRSADGLSESVTIPEWMLAGEFAFYNTTYYGQKYLILSKPYLDGAVFVVGGATTP